MRSSQSLSAKAKKKHRKKLIHHRKTLTKAMKTKRLTLNLNKIEIVNSSFYGQIVQREIDNGWNSWCCIRYLLMPSNIRIGNTIYEHRAHLYWPDNIKQCNIRLISNSIKFMSKCLLNHMCDSKQMFVTCKKAALSVSLSVSIQNCIRPVVCCNLPVQLICCSCVIVVRYPKWKPISATWCKYLKYMRLLKPHIFYAKYAPLVFVIYAPYPFQWSPIGIHVGPESFELEPRIAILSIAQIHDKIPNIHPIELD